MPKQETRVRSLSQEDPLEKEVATHSSILAWEILCTEGAWWATVYEVERVRCDLETNQQQKLVTNLWALQLLDRLLHVSEVSCGSGRQLG